jgi:hypothetical protein
MSKQPKRILVKETKRYWGDFEGTFTEIIASLQNAMDEGWEGILAESYGYDGGVEYYLYKHREENDKEYGERMKQLEKNKEIKLRAKEKRRQLYETLRKEFVDDLK